MTTGPLTRLPDGGDLKPVIDAAQAALDLENQRADRLDSKARNQMTLAASWFAVVQAVAAVALKAGTPRGWVIVIAVVAVIAGVALVVAMRMSAEVWKLRPQPAVTQETLEDMATAAQTEPETFEERLILQYRHILGHAQETNERRADALQAATVWWWLTLGLALVELTVAFLARVLNV